MKNDRISLQIRLDEKAIYEPLKAIAKHEMRSLNAQLEYFLRNSIDDYIKNAHFSEEEEFIFFRENDEEIED